MALAGVLAACVVMSAVAGAGLCGCESKPKGTFNITGPDSGDLSDAIRATQRGDALFKEGKHKEAIDAYQRSIQIRGNVGATWNNLGLALLADNNRYDAQQAFLRAGDLLPNDPKPMENLGVLYMNAGLPEDAMRYYELALERSPTHLPALRGVVLAAQQLGRSDEAMRERIKQALLIETDAKWRETFSRQRVRVEQDLADEARDRGEPGA